MKSTKLSPRLLRQIIEEEVSKFGKMEGTEDRADDTDETDADEYADALGNKIDYVKALKIEEGRLSRRLLKVRETRERVLKSLNARK